MHLRWRKQHWLSSAARSFEPSVGGMAYITLDWLAACVVYFFLFAAIGQLFDKERERPVWWWTTIAFYAIACVLAAIIPSAGTLGPALTIFFPFAFGLFFTGSAFALLSGDLASSLLAKTVFDLLFLTAFGSWIWLTIRERRPTLRHTLLFLLFCTLLLGLSGCLQAMR
jgi:hypothetical protein